MLDLHRILWIFILNKIKGKSVQFMRGYGEK